jgi:hypothetical protein
MADNSVTLNVYNPTGAIETTTLHAPRLDTLEGKTICELSNAGWEYDRVFPAVRELLQKRFPTAKIIPYNEAVWLRPQIENLEEVSKVIKEKGCQAVITGMAA